MAFEICFGHRTHLKTKMNMQVYFAPLEGITDAVYRRAHFQLFGGVSKYFIPFLSPTQDRRLTTRELRAVAPQENRGLPAVPQILTKDPSLFLWLTVQLRDMGYSEVNLNLGCPSGTVTAKGKGSGMLQDPDALRRFLDAVFAASPLPVSIKTRIGYVDESEWEALWEVLHVYPMLEIILHPRTRREFYRGPVHMQVFEKLSETCRSPLVYNGDLFDLPSARMFAERFPGVQTVMCGRGLAANPALAREIAGGLQLHREELYAFHETIYREYARLYDDRIVLGKMRDIVKYLACCYVSPRKALKAVFKARTPEEYTQAVQILMSRDLREHPGYSEADDQL